MVDWDLLENELVEAYRTRVRHVRHEVERKLATVDDDGLLASLSQAIDSVFRTAGRTTKALTAPELATPPDRRAAPPPDSPAAPSEPTQPAATKPISEPTPSQPDANAPVDPLFTGLQALEAALATSALELPADSVAFLPKAPTTFASFSPEDKTGAKGTQVLTDCVRLLDRLENDLALQPSVPGLGEQLATARGDLLSLLERDRTCIFFPGPSCSAEAAQQRFGAGAVETIRLPSAAPAGRLLTVVERGLLLAGKPKRKATIMVSSGAPNDLSQLLEGARASLRAAPAQVTHGDRVKAARALDKLWAQSAAAKTENEQGIVLRYAFNALVPLGVDDGPVGRALSALRQALRKVGLQEVSPQRGERFDTNKFKPDRFDRRTVSSTAPAGTIVRILQPGFLNRQGICVQKAVIGVSGGK